MKKINDMESIEERIKDYCKIKALHHVKSGVISDGFTSMRFDVECYIALVRIDDIDRIQDYLIETNLDEEIIYNGYILFYNDINLELINGERISNEKERSGICIIFRKDEDGNRFKLERV